MAIVTFLMAVALYVTAMILIAFVNWYKHEDKQAQARRAPPRRDPPRPEMPPWIRHGLALIRHASVQSIVNDIVSVQPMRGQGRIRYLDIATHRSAEPSEPAPASLRYFHDHLQRQARRERKD